MSIRLIYFKQVCVDKVNFSQGFYMIKVNFFNSVHFLWLRYNVGE